MKTRSLDVCFHSSTMANEIHHGWVLRYDAGTIVLDGAAQADARVPDALQWDARVNRWRAPALAYREVVTQLVRAKTPFTDRAKDYDSFAFRVLSTKEPRPYQAAALERWKANGKRGAVILPTGAGKSLVAELAIAMTGRAALVIVPTLDLMNQWYNILIAAFDAEIGLIGGGYFERGAITVTTYSSAFRHMERLGDKFGLIVFDECHHLPGSAYRYAAELAIAPFRLGLTATPERSDGADAELGRLVGDIIFRQEIEELAGGYLADYRTVRVPVNLSADERERYESERRIYRDFVARERIMFSSLDGWQRFVMASARSSDGRRAMQAYRESKRIALGTDAKLRTLDELLIRHAHERAIIFTAENEIVYRISEQFLVPAITHQTPIKERRRWLEAFNAGEVKALATSKVLNEGVNIPEAAVAIVLSGSGSTREHVQRLGRILRPQPGKQAVLYEVVTRDTAEENISDRRTQASPFQRDPNLSLELE